MELHYLTIAEAARQIHARRLSPVELTEACLDRVKALDSELHAFITVTAEQALDEARQAENEIAAGRYRGPLHGIPIAHKDMLCTRGVRTTAHSNLLRDWVPEINATAYERLKHAGAVSLGKLSMWEFAYGNPGPAVAFPPARNPWNMAYSPAGSSSGSGAAVAAGLCFGATGTDTGGSIRQPSAACAVVGMKPTFGRVSVHGVIPLAPSLDHVGPITRTVSDNAAMLQAIAGYDPRDPASLREPVPDFLGRMGQDIGGIRLGVPRRAMGSIDYDSQCLTAFDEALKVLRGLGVKTVEFDFPGLGNAADLGAKILLAEAYAYHKDNLEKTPEKYDLSFRERVLEASRYSDAELREARVARAELKEQYAALFRSGIDVIASPGNDGIPDSMESLCSNRTGRRGSFASTRLYNMSGMPALAMPMGNGAQGMPLGIQFAANLLAEDRIYQIAAAYEAATPWVARHPTT